MSHRFQPRQKIRRLFYAGLEAYPSRYTYQLEDWNRRVFEANKLDWMNVKGRRLTQSQEIKTGSVLDAHGRTFYSMTQVSELVRIHGEGRMSNEDVIFFEDMFTPGIESLAYIFDQVPASQRPRVFVRCLAQSVDPDDFVCRTGMSPWMRKYEHLVDHLVHKSGGAICVASEELVAHLRITGFKSPIYVTGLPFGKNEVQSYVPKVPWSVRPPSVVFAARWDSEKQPLFYLEVARQVTAIKPAKFYVLTGHKELKSNDPRLLDALHECKDFVTLKEGLTKKQYYRMLSSSKVLFNCALQDWVSNTVSEADALGAMTIFPAYRSFPEVFANNREHMYIPWSVDDAVEKVVKALTADSTPPSVGQVSDYQDQTILRTIQAMERNPKVSNLCRELDEPYRHHVSEPKYKIRG